MFIKPLVLLAFCVRALSLPANDEALDNRKHKAWIDSFEDEDTTCSNESTFVNTYSDRWPLSDGSCVNFSSQSSRVGGSWGNIDTIETFIDSSCTEHHSFLPPRNKNEFGFCVMLDGTDNDGDADNPAFWHSVKGYASKPLSLPTTNEALEKRHHSGAWVASYDITDTSCTNAPADDDRTKLSNGKCMPFPFTGSMVGGSWGDIDIIEAFADLTCTATGPAVNITRLSPGEKEFCTPSSALGPLGCENRDSPCSWSSMRGHTLPPG